MDKKIIESKKQPCNKCGIQFQPVWLKDGICNGCRNPELVVTSMPNKSRFIQQWEKPKAFPGTVLDGTTWQYYAELTDGRIIEGYASPDGIAWAMVYGSIYDYRLEKNYREILCLVTSSLEQAKIAIELAADKLEAETL